MEDDGLLMNFVTTDGPTTKTNAKVVGGKWKDRRKAQLKSQGKRRGGASKPAMSAANSTSTEGATSRSAPPKTGAPKKANRDTTVTSSDSRTGKFVEKHGAAGGANNTYVSSLFTSNTKSQDHASTSTAVDAAPSNAPLADATNFGGLGIEDPLLQHVTDHLKFSKPTKIQRSVLPRLLTRDRDFFIQAQTGSGKTLAFCLPIFQKLVMARDINRSSGIMALILTPTRELATQIYSVLETLTRCCHRIVPGIVIGGEKKKSEKARLRKGVNILVATPGRLGDHIDNTQSLDLSKVRYVVLDEGDRLMELGFEETITKILGTIRNQATSEKLYTLPDKQVTVLCSATIKPNVKKLGDSTLEDYEMVTASSVPDEESLVVMENIAAPDQLVQEVLVVPPKLRLVSLCGLLKKVTTEEGRTMVFLSCSDSVDFHFDVFTRGGKTINKEGQWVAPVGDSTVLTSTVADNVVFFKLHGSLSQQVRTSTLNQFVKEHPGKHLVMLCTDVASRGLDLPHISTVIEYDPPFATEDHLHRIGRSARAGSKGHAVLFILPGDEELYIEHIEQFHPTGMDHLKYEDILKAGFGEKWDYDATTWHLNVERRLLEDPAMNAKAVQGFTSHVRAYATHLSSERKFFNVRTLHLGHLAKSFGLRETPKQLGGNKRKHEPEDGKRKKEDARTKMLRMAKMAVNSHASEFNY